MSERLTPEREAEIRQYVEANRRSVKEFRASLSAAERNQAVLLAEVDRLRAELAALQPPTNFHNADHEARLRGLFADIAREFADQPDVIANQVLLHSQSVIWVVEREYMRLYQLARAVLQSGPEGVAQYAKDNGCNGMVVAQSGSLDPEIEKLQAAGWVLEDRVEYVGGKRIRFMRPPTSSERSSVEPEIEPDPADPRQIAVSLMLEHAREINDVRDMLPDYLKDHSITLTEVEHEQLIDTVANLAETADITIGWSEQNGGAQ